MMLMNDEDDEFCILNIFGVVVVVAVWTWIENRKRMHKKGQNVLLV